MRILSFYAAGLHGYLNFELTFHPDLSLLTGINGSGKTTALNSIIALLNADLSVLANLEYDMISLVVSHEGEEIHISSSRSDSVVSLFVNDIDEPLTFTLFYPSQDQPYYKQQDAEQEYYRELAGMRAAHPVLRSISLLPKPMFLGIDRRSNLGFSRYESSRMRAQRFGKNIFGQSLAESVAAAADLASKKYRDAIIQASKLTERLQREVLLGFLGEEASSSNSSNRIRLPTAKDRKELRTIRRDVDSIATMMQLPTRDVRKLLLPLFDKLLELSELIPNNTTIDEVLRGDLRHEVVNAVVGWSASQPRLERIRFISNKVAGYNVVRQKILSETREYEDLINKFLADSGKKISLVDDGTMEVRIDGVKDAKSVSSLSSGEAQIFVILTHLAFNPSAMEDNVFIIDEPELSLHIQWQEMFVDSVLAANPNIQYILATHSPSIILDRLDNCIESSIIERGH